MWWISNDIFPELEYFDSKSWMNVERKNYATDLAAKIATGGGKDSSGQLSGLRKVLNACINGQLQSYK